MFARDGGPEETRTHTLKAREPKGAVTLVKENLQEAWPFGAELPYHFSSDMLSTGLAQAPFLQR